MNEVIGAYQVLTFYHDSSSHHDSHRCERGGAYWTNSHSTCVVAFISCLVQRAKDKTGAVEEWLHLHWLLIQMYSGIGGEDRVTPTPLSRNMDTISYGCGQLDDTGQIQLEVRVEVRLHWRRRYTHH